MMLEVRGISAGYGEAVILRDVSLAVAPGEILCVLGRNGAGKTTLMKAIMGLVRVRVGAILLDGEAISTLPAHEVPRHRVGYIPQGRRLFADSIAASASCSAARPSAALTGAGSLFIRLL